MILFGSRGKRGFKAVIPGHSPVRRTRAVADALESRLLLSASHKIVPLTQVQPAVAATIPLNSSTWTAVGPAALNNGSSGRLAAVAGDPNNANVLYLAAAGGGVWKTVDGGVSWTPVTDGQSTLFMGALAVAPSNSNVIYAGTGEATSSGLSFYGRGVLKSSDAGTTWTLMGNSVFNRHTISQLVVDPTNESTIYVAVAGGGVDGVGGNTGIWKSTNGGTNWANMTTAISTSGNYSDVEIDPTNPQHLVCSLYSASSANGVYTTINGGTSWTLVTGGLPNGSTLGNTKIAIAPSNPQDLYVSFADPASGALLSMWTSSNGGAAWTQLSSAPNYMGGQGWYDSALAVDRHNPNVVFAAGQAGTNSVIESRDGGQTWTDIHSGINGGGPHADHHGFGFDADGHLLDGNDGGIWRLDTSTPGSISWSDLNANLQITQFIGGSLDPTNPNNAFAGSQDNGTEQFTGSTVWTVREGGDGGLAKIDQQNPNIVYHQAPVDSFGATNFFRKSTDGGVTWTAAVSGINTLDSQNFYAPFFVDPNNGNHLFYGTSQLYESSNAAGSWTAIGSPGLNGWPAGSSNINTIAMAPSAPGTVYATFGGSFMSTTNDGATWTAHNPMNLAGSAGQILVDPANSLICYLVATTFGQPHVLKTVDGGTTWTNISGNLPDLPTYSIALNPAANTMYVGNDNGVYASTDGGTTWNQLGFGLPNVQVRDLEFNSSLDVLAAITHGRGMYEIAPLLQTPIVVNTTVDETTDGDGLTSLREAVALANAGGGTITFDPSVIGGTISLTAGPLSISNGVVINGPNSRLLTISTGSGSPLEIAGGATVTIANLVLSSSSTALQVDSTGRAGLLDVSVGGNITDNGTLGFYQVISDTVAGSISGSGSLTKTGPQSLSLSGSDSYTGGTTISAGTLTGSTNALKGSISVSYPGTLAFDQSSLPGTTGFFSGTASGSGTVRVLGPSSIVQFGTTNGLTPSTFTNSGPTVIDPGAAIFASASNDLSSTSTLIVNGTLNLGGFPQVIGALSGGPSGLLYSVTTQPTPIASLVEGANNASTQFDGLIEDVPLASGNAGRVALQTIGTGTFTLSRPAGVPNTYTGGTTISAGTLNGNTAAIEGSVSDNAILGFDQTLGSLGDGTFSGSVSGSGRLNVLAGTVRLASSATLQNSGASTITGTLVGPASGGANALSSLSAYTVNGVLDLGASNQTIASLSGGGAVYHFQPIGQPVLATLALGDDNSSALFTGILEDTALASGNAGLLAVSKAGTGVFTLTGANTFTGGLNVLAGLLAVGPSPMTADPMGGGAVTLNGGNLTLNGRIAGTAQQIVAATGYNQDVIAEAAAANAQAGTSIAFDTNYVWYEHGFTGSGTTGLPANGTPFVSAFNPAVSFQLQPFTSNNVAFIPGGNGSVTLTLATPTAFSELNFLATAANGNANLSTTLNFSDGTSAIVQITVSDWFNGAQAAFTAGGRIIRSTTSTVTLVSGNPRLYEYDYIVPLIDQAKSLTSITFHQTSGNQLGIFGLSGAASVVAATQSYPNTIQVLSPASIDVENSPTASLGNLLMAGSVLSLTGPSGSNLTFGPVTLNASSQFSTAAGTTLALGAVSGGPTVSLTKLGTGTLKLAGADTYGGATTASLGTLVAVGGGSLPGGPLSISSTAIVQLQQNASSFTANVSALAISAGGRLDLNNNTLFVNYGATADSVATLRSYLANGYNGGTWSGAASLGTGVISSSTAAGGPAGVYGLGYADSVDGIVSGQPANSVEIRYTLMGDANLDGTVNGVDALLLGRNYGAGAVPAWDRGDFNYDALVNLSDATFLRTNYNKVLPASVASAVAAAVNVVRTPDVAATPTPTTTRSVIPLSLSMVIAPAAPLSEDPVASPFSGPAESNTAVDITLAKSSKHPHQAKPAKKLR